MGMQFACEMIEALFLVCEKWISPICALV